MFQIFKRNFLEWKDYKEKVDFLDIFYWQQKVRKENIKNL